MKWTLYALVVAFLVMACGGEASIAPVSPTIETRYPSATATNVVEMSDPTVIDVITPTSEPITSTPEPTKMAPTPTTEPTEAATAPPEQATIEPQETVVRPIETPIPAGGQCPFGPSATHPNPWCPDPVPFVSAYGDWSLSEALSVLFCESSGDANAISRSGAVGFFQLYPTGSYDPAQNVAEAHVKWRYGVGLGNPWEQWNDFGSCGNF